MNSDTKTQRAAIYARSATDINNQSISRQIRQCRIAAKEKGLEVVMTHSDACVSGTTHIVTRDGGKKIMTGAQNGSFDVLLVDSIDRLSRNNIEQVEILRKLKTLGIRIISVLDDYDSISGHQLLIEQIATKFRVNGKRKLTHPVLILQFKIYPPG